MRELGRYVFGVAALGTGIVTLIWHGAVATYLEAAVQIFGGAAIIFRPTMKAGGALLSAFYLIMALLCVPRIIAHPQIYDSWGNFFEPFSLATGAAIVYPRISSNWARTLFGICVASFTLEQAFYLGNTAALVPTWLPPSPMFWAQATTVFFALGAVALLINRMAPLATRLLTLMIVLFGLLAWIPQLLSAPQSHENWSEFAETFTIAGAAWILADLLRGTHVRSDDTAG